MWRWRYALIEPVVKSEKDSDRVEYYSLIDIRELCIASLFLMEKGYPRRYASITERVKRPKTERDSESTLRAVDLFLWKGGVTTPSKERKFESSQNE